MQNKYAYLGLGAAFIGGAALGGVIGHQYAFKKFYAAYDQVLAEEVQKAKEFYANLHKAPYPTPADAVADLVPDVKLEEATTALRGYLGQEPAPMEDDEEEIVEVEVVERNIFEDGDQLKIRIEDRDRSKPYPVTVDEYMEVPDGFEDIQLTYYAGDNVLADDSDEPITDVDGIVGDMNLMMFGASDPDQPNILLVRNDQKKMNVEVSYSPGKFSYEVLGLEHSDEPRRRVKPRWDDE